MTIIAYLTTGDNRSVRSWTIRNGPLPTSPPLDLTTATAVEIHVPGMPITPMACTFIADATGTVSHSFTTAEIGTVAGSFSVETKVTFADATVVRTPKPLTDSIQIQAALG